MGLFSAKKTIQVSSTVYNMAGDEINRPNFLKSTMFGAVMSPHQKFLGETLVTSYLTGPGMKQRQMYNYAVRNNFAGLPTYSVRRAAAVSLAVVKTYLPIPGSPSGLVAEIQDAFVADGDYDYFAEQHILENYPDLADTDYVAEYNKGAHTITIQFEGGGTTTFGAGSFDINARYIVSHFYTKLAALALSVVPGTPVTNVSSGSLPSTSGYTLVSTVNTGSVGYALSKTQTETKVYSDGSPTVVTVTYPTPTEYFDGIDTLRTKTRYDGNDGLESSVRKTEFQYNRSEYRQIFSSSSTNVVVNDLGGGDTETVTTDITGDFLRARYDYQIDTQESIVDEVYGGAKLFIYKVGTGNAVLDALDVVIGSPVTAEFYPFIPVRLNNTSIMDAAYISNGLYDECRKLYKKAAAKEKFATLVEKVEDTPDLSEVDYGYIQWGVTLNTKEQDCLEYLYGFFKALMPLQDTDSVYMTTTYPAQITAYNAAKTTYQNWLTAQANPVSSLYGDPRPTIPSLASPKTTTIRLNTDDPRLQDFDNRISWVHIGETSHTGLGKVGAKKGDLWFVKSTDTSWDVITGTVKTLSFGVGDATPAKVKTTTNLVNQTYLYKQTGDNTYTRLRIWGLIHENYIYGGKCVKITASEALDDVDESGFLIPLHAPTIKDVGLVSSTQMSTANTYIVFNSYKIFKKKWYQTFLGMLLIFLVVITIAAIVAPQLVGGMSGALGTNASVGAGLGLSGTAGIVAGAMTNVVAGMLISMALSEVSTALFGEKWGAIISSLVTLAMSFGAGAGGISNIANFFTPEKLLALSSAIANGISGFMQGQSAEMQAEMVTNQAAYDKEMRRIQKMIDDMGGNNNLYFDPTQLTDTAKGNGSGTGGGYMPEGLDEFINRTTLTGSDIVEITLSFVNDYSNLSLTLPRD